MSYSYIDPRATCLLYDTADTNRWSISNAKSLIRVNTLSSKHGMEKNNGSPIYHHRLKGKHLFSGSEMLVCWWRVSNEILIVVLIRNLSRQRTPMDIEKEDLTRTSSLIPYYLCIVKLMQKHMITIHGARRSWKIRYRSDGRNSLSPNEVDRYAGTTRG